MLQDLQNLFGYNNKDFSQTLSSVQSAVCQREVVKFARVYQSRLLHCLLLRGIPLKIVLLICILDEFGNALHVGEENEIDELPQGNDEEEFGKSRAVGEENEIDEQPEGNNEEELGDSWAVGGENEIDEQPERNNEEELGDSWAVGEENQIDEQPGGNGKEELGDT